MYVNSTARPGKYYSPSESSDFFCMGRAISANWSFFISLYLSGTTEPETLSHQTKTSSHYGKHAHKVMT